MFRSARGSQTRNRASFYVCTPRNVINTGSAQRHSKPCCDYVALSADRRAASRKRSTVASGCSAMVRATPAAGAAHESRFLAQQESLFDRSHRVQGKLVVALVNAARCGGAWLCTRAADTTEPIRAREHWGLVEFDRR